MLIPISWTVSKAVAMPGREKREKGQMKGRRGGAGKMERACAEHRRRRVWQLMCSRSTTETHGHDDCQRRPSPSLHPPSRPRGRLLAKMAPAAIFQHRF